MSEKIIVVTSDEKIETVDYTDFISIQRAVNGSFELFATSQMAVDKDIILDICLFCNEEFLIDDSEEFDKINAFGTLLSGKEIRGNVAILIDTLNCDNRGFESLENSNNEEALCECSIVKKILEQFIFDNKEKVKKLHDKYDNNKSNPFGIFLQI